MLIDLFIFFALSSLFAFNRLINYESKEVPNRVCVCPNTLCELSSSQYTITCPYCVLLSHQPTREGVNVALCVCVCACIIVCVTGHVPLLSAIN